METKQQGRDEVARARAAAAYGTPRGRQGGAGGPERQRRSLVSSFLVRFSQIYVVLYLIIILLALVLDVLLRQQMDAERQRLVETLAWASTGLYAVALVVVLVTFALRLHRGKRHTWGLRLLYLGVASGLVARGYFGASLVMPKLQREPLPPIMANLGLFAGTVILLGLILSMLDAVRFLGRTVVGWVNRVRMHLPWLR
jgi:hypothetical protein